jgi:hypothetical protein
MLHVFHPDAGCCICCKCIHVYCKCMFQMFHLFQTYIATILSRCCIYFSGDKQMLQVSIQKCFICFRHMLQLFLSRCCIYCGCYTHMLQAYVLNISPISDVCCRSDSCCNINRKWAHVETVLASATVPMCAASDVGGSCLHAHQQAWGAQMHAIVHQHVGASVQAQQLHSSCGGGQTGQA